MRFRQGMRIRTFDDKDVGQLEQLVIDPQTKELTHLVVKKGFLFTEDKIVPLSMIAMTDEDSVYLHEDVPNLDELPPYEETHYIALDDTERGEFDYPSPPALYWIPPFGGWLDYAGGYSYPPPYSTTTTENMPEGTVALRQGAEVYSSNNELLGHVDTILTEAASDRASYFTLETPDNIKRLVPMAWVRDVYEDRLLLTVGKSMVERLKEYHPESN
jgi:uncharacterized protein YrrD